MLFKYLKVKATQQTEQQNNKKILGKAGKRLKNLEQKRWNNEPIIGWLMSA